MSGTIAVLVVEDERTAAAAHRMYVERLDGFSVVAVAHSRVEALRVLERQPVDLILLDLNLPDGPGLRLVRTMRAAGHTADVVAVTSARDLDMVRQAVSLGVVQYVLKPFTFPTLRDRLERWAHYRRELLAGGEAAGQDEVDRALSTLRSPGPPVLPKGLSGPTLAAITMVLREAAEGISANVAAQTVGVSRITARRYLEHLVDIGRAARSPRYGQVGRPELRYRWTGR